MVPLLATVIVIFFFVGHADSLIRPLFFVSGQPWDFTGIGIIVFFIIFYLIGVLVAPGGRRALDFINTVLGHTPVVKTIFGVTQQATSAITSQYNFSRVVFVEWPREGMIAMGFVTGRLYSQSRDGLSLKCSLVTICDGSLMRQTETLPGGGIHIWKWRECGNITVDINTGVYKGSPRS